MPKVEIALGGRTRNVDVRVAEYLVKKGRGAYATRDMRAAPPAPVVAKEPEVEAPPAPVVAEPPKPTVSTAEAKARREASKHK